MIPKPLPPIKAKLPGRGGRKHVLATARLNETGQVEIYLVCQKSRCGCGGWYVLEELLTIYEDILRGEGEAA